MVLNLLASFILNHLACYILIISWILNFSYIFQVLVKQRHAKHLKDLNLSLIKASEFAIGTLIALLHTIFHKSNLNCLSL